MASTATIRQRKRKLCPKCDQLLSHSAYVRHQNPAVCPEKNIPFESLVQYHPKIELDTESESFVTPPYQDEHLEIASSSSESDEVESDEVEIFDEDNEFGVEDDALLFNTGVSREKSHSTESEQSSNFNHGQHCAGAGETSECLDNEMVTEAETEYVVNNGEESMEEIFSITSPRQILMKSVAFHICLFISFFQLCYHVSERGITLLLNFI